MKKRTTSGNDQRCGWLSKFSPDLNTLLGSVTYNGFLPVFLVSKALIGALMLCEWFMPSLAGYRNAVSVLFEQYFLRIVECYAGKYRMIAKERGSYDDFVLSDLVDFIMKHSISDIRRVARGTFFTVLGWHNVNTADDMPPDTAGNCSDVLDFVIGRSQGIPKDLQTSDQWWDEFHERPGVTGLNAVKAFIRASGAAARDVSVFLSYVIPRLIVAFFKEHCSGGLCQTAIVRNIELTSQRVELSAEQRANIKRRILEHIDTGDADDHSLDAIIAVFFDRPKFCSFRSTLSMACRSKTAETYGTDKDLLLDNLCCYQDIIGFLKMLDESGMTVAQMLEYAMAGAERHFGLYVQDMLRCQTADRLKHCAGEKAIDVLRAAVGSDDHKALCDYVQRSNSKINNKF